MMNKIDKKFHRALNFLSKHSTLDILNMLTDNKKKFRKYVSKDMDRTLQNHKYIIFQPEAINVLTIKGLQYLKDLEEIKRKDLTLIAFGITVTISLIALGFSLFSFFNSV